MRLPAITGIIDRRILVNYRVAPAAIAAILPPPFRPKIIRGHAIGGICLIRLKKVRPSFLPVAIGITSENAAHRIAVEWNEGDAVREGVFVPRRDTSCLLNQLAGGRLFPGEHHAAKFIVEETDTQLSVEAISRDGSMRVAVKARTTDVLPSGSIFASMDEASLFFERGSLGYSVTSEAGRYDGIELCCKRWQITPLAVDEVASSFFDDASRFPVGTVTFDNALLMRDIDHEWLGRDDLCCPVKSS